MGSRDRRPGHGYGGGMRPGQQGRNPWEAGGGAHRTTNLATEAAEFLEAIITGLFGLAGWLLRHPLVLLGAGVLGVLWWAWGPFAAGGLVVLVLVVGLLWRWRKPVSFDRRCWRHVRAGFLRLLVYEPRWPRWARACRLVWESDEIGEVLPRLRSVTSGPCWDELRIRMVPGQRQRDFEEAAESLAQSRKVARCVVREVAPGVLSVGFARRDGLATGVTLPDIPDVTGDEQDLTRVHIGSGEYGNAWHVPVLGNHVFGAGMTGAGKGSILWGVVRQLAPAISCGRVRLSMIDPKGGMEAEMGRELYYAYARDEPDDILALLSARVDAMDARKRELRGRVRRLDPTREQPLDLLIIDELAAVTKYLGDRKKQAEAERLIGLLLSQGRAPGQLVHAYVQEPTKDVVPMRSLFPYRVAMRLDSPMQVDMVLGDGQWERGAWADRIAPSTPGTAYVVEEGVREPLRMRAGYTSDDEIRRIAHHYRPRPANR